MFFGRLGLSSVGLALILSGAIGIERLHPLYAQEPAQQPAMTTSELLRLGISQLDKREYEEALATLQQLKPEDLADKDQKTLSEKLAIASSAAGERKKARAEFELGEKDMAAGKPGEAAVHYEAASDNRYADAGTREKALEKLQLAQVSLRKSGESQATMYSEAQADLKAGNLEAARKKFQTLASTGYKPGLFQRTPGDYLAEIDKRMAQTPEAAPAAPTPPAEPKPQVERAADAKRAYETAREQYRAGNWIDARTNFQLAQQLGYKAGLFEDSPQTYLGRMDRKEQEDALKATRAAQPSPPPAPAPALPQPPAPAPEPVAVAPPAPAPPAPVPAPAETVAPPSVPTPPAPAPAEAPPAPAPAPMEITPRPVAPQPAPAPAETTTVPVPAPAPMEIKPEPVVVQPVPAPAPAQPPPVPVPTPAPMQISPLPVPAQTEPAQTTTPAPAPLPPGPAPSPSAMQALAATAQLERIRAQQRGYEAQGLVEQGRKAQGENRFQEALALYTRAAELDPTNQQAIAGRNEMQTVTGKVPEPSSLLERQEKLVEAQREAIRYSFNTAISKAAEAIAAADYKTAEAQLAAARVARDQNPNIFTPDEVRSFNATIANTQITLDRGRQERAALEQAKSIQETREAQLRRQQEELVSRQNTVADLIKSARRAIEESKYKEALGIIDQILTLDPNNDYAQGVRPLVEDRAEFLEQRGYERDFRRQLTRQFNAAEEKKIPYDDIFRYPSNWPDISATRDASVEKEHGTKPEDVQVQAQLDRRLPEVRFEAVAFSDVIEFLRDITGANIFVNWRALETSGIDKNTPVTARLRDVKFSKALTTILSDVGGGTVKLTYTIDEGVITISTVEDLSKNVVTRTYDIRDLIFEVQQFQAPEFNLQQQQGGGTPGQGGGGGGGGQGLFQNQQGQGQQGGQQLQQQRTDRITQITQLIEETVAADSWRDAGGAVGSLRELSGQLVITQTPENQREVASLLAQLREQRAIQITIETRFLTVQRNFLEDIGLDLDFVFNNQNPLRTVTVDPDGIPNSGDEFLRRIPGSGRFSPISVTQAGSTFTAGPVTGAPGSIGSSAGNAVTVSGTFLDDFQVNLLLRATQASVQTTLLTAPRVTLYNGQQAFITVDTRESYVASFTVVAAGGAIGGQGAVGLQPIIQTLNSGVGLTVSGTVSADRKYVTLTVQPTLAELLELRNFDFPQPTATGIVHTNIQQPIIRETRLGTTVSVPDGGTLLLGGQTLAGEVEREIGVPILSKVPFLKRLFTNRSTAKDEQVLLILVKPSIIIQREVEEKQFPLLSSKVGGAG